MCYGWRRLDGAGRIELLNRCLSFPPISLSLSSSSSFFFYLSLHPPPLSKWLRRIGTVPAAAGDKSWWSRFFYGGNNSSGNTTTGVALAAPGAANPTRRQQGQPLHRRHRLIVQKLMEETSLTDGRTTATSDATAAGRSKESTADARQETGACASFTALFLTAFNRRNSCVFFLYFVRQRANSPASFASPSS